MVPQSDYEVATLPGPASFVPIPDLIIHPVRLHPLQAPSLDDVKSNSVSSVKAPNMSAQPAEITLDLLTGTLGNHTLEEMGNWFAGSWGKCNGACEPAVKRRSVLCKSLLNFSVIDSKWCSKYPKPTSTSGCSCSPLGLEVCEPSSGACAVPEDRQNDFHKRVRPGYVDLGCFELAPGDVGVAITTLNCGARVLDLTCHNWASELPCRSGFAFYKFCNPGAPMTEADCFARCLHKGMDMAAVVQGTECRCGATASNADVWRSESPPANLTFDINGHYAVESSAEHVGLVCPLKVLRYTGAYESGFVPIQYVSSNVLDQAYKDSIVTGLMIDPESEEERAFVHSDIHRRAKPRPNATQAAATQANATQRSGSGPARRIELLPGHSADGLPRLSATQAVAMQANATHRSGADPKWTRSCYPETCGAGSPWRLRQSANPTGGAKSWEHYTIVPYMFDDSGVQPVDDARKEAFRAAAVHWSDKTCIVLQESQNATSIDPLGVYARVKVVDLSSCYVSGVGYSQNVINLGSCNSIVFLGTIVHEIGHALGMLNEQQRQDADASYHGQGPHLKVLWDQIPDDWMAQYSANDNSYIGSARDGDRDPHSGYAPYDFGSVMHDSAMGRFETIPAEEISNTGQRVGLSAGDILQANDMYQCIPETGLASAPTPAPVHPEMLVISGVTDSCPYQTGLNGEWARAGSTSTGHSYYTKDGWRSLYFDQSCNGAGWTSTWVFDNSMPNTTAKSDLDGDGKCSFMGYLYTDTELPPMGSFDWGLWCSSLGFSMESITITEGTPAPTMSQNVTTAPTPTPAIVHGFEISNSCSQLSFLDGRYIAQGTMRSGLPYYKHDRWDVYWYWDESCNGGNFQSLWIVDSDAPDTNATSDLDGDGTCSFWGYKESAGELFEEGTQRLTMFCGSSWTSVDLTLSELTDTSAPTPAPTTPSPTPGPTPSPTPGPTPSPTPAPPDTPRSLPSSPIPGGPVPSPPTPRPTVDTSESSAVGDPHVKSVSGRHFDINQPGNYTLVRVPAERHLPAKLELNVTLAFNDKSRPCGLYIVGTTLGGELLPGQDVSVRPLRRNARGSNNAGTATLLPFSVRFASAFSEAGGGQPRVEEAYYRAWDQLPQNGTLLSPRVRVVPLWNEAYGAGNSAKRAEAQAFQFLVSGGTEDLMSIQVSQAARQALDVRAFGLGNLGFKRIGGLLGTEGHDPRIESFTMECHKARAKSILNTQRRSAERLPPEGGSSMTASWSAPMMGPSWRVS